MLRLARPRRLAALLIVLAIALSVVPLPMLAPGPGASDPQAAAAVIKPRTGRPPALSHEVYGYLPWWRLDVGTAGRLRYDLLTTIALFGVGIRADGSLDRASPGYLGTISPAAAAVTNAAHAHGVRVVPTFQLFDSGRLPDLRAFLGSSAAQTRFIRQAVALVTARGADGANLDLEPVPDELGGAFARFVARFRAALRAHDRTSTLVVATAAGAAPELIEALAKSVDGLFVMAYEYRTGQSGSAGSVAPLDGPGQTVRSTIERYLRHAPAAKIILGIAYYGYDWPVTAMKANAPVRTNAERFGSPFSVSFSSVNQWLADHPKVVVKHDPTSGAAWFTYRDGVRATYRQVWFEDQRSIAAKEDYAILAGLGGVGIWALDNDRGNDQLWELLRTKFRNPVHQPVVRASLYHLGSRSGRVEAEIAATIQNRGSVPEVGRIVWTIRNAAGRIIASGGSPVTVLTLGARRPVLPVVLGSARDLAPGTYTLHVAFTVGSRRWTAPIFSFRQPY
jgi:spore germination protein